MVDLVFKKDDKGNLEGGYVEGVTFVYCQIREARPKFNPEEGKEWKVDVIVDEDTADAWQEAFPKNSVKKIKTAMFKEQYKIDPVFPDEKNQFVLTVKDNAQKPDGTPKTGNMRPSVVLNGKTPVNITETTNVGNGSTGKLFFTVFNGAKGSVVYLRGILVEDLVEYEGTGSRDASGFDAILAGAVTQSSGSADIEEDDDKEIPF